MAPVDLAQPRKDEANRLFSTGRYREARSLRKNEGRSYKKKELRKKLRGAI